MPLIILTTHINAPVERCFDLSRSIDLHMLSTARTDERAIAGRTSGLIEVGETVTWEAVHFGVRQRMIVRIEEMNRPHFFSDRMLKGAFKSMYHEHHFDEVGAGTLMTDRFSFESPMGIVGRLVNKVVLKKYMTRFLEERNEMIRQMAEGEDWQKLL